MIAVAILSITAAIECGIVFQHILRCNLAAWVDILPGLKDGEDVNGGELELEIREYLSEVK